MERLKDYKWFKISGTVAELQFPSTGFIELQVNEKILCIVSFKDQLFACTARCPHAGGRLSEGYVDAVGNIICPLHHYKFNLQNGRNTSGEGYFLKMLPVEVRKEGVFVGFEENGLLKWLK